ncbi:TPA: acyltransferase family protein [Serratia fonticola]
MQAKKTWSMELEGLRGLASLWVVLGHICILVNFHFPILSDPAIGVDLFILLSGFLMAKNYIERQNKEPWTAVNTFRKFWLRRFFRIAPLYYFLLIVAIIFGGYYGEYRDVISDFYPATQTNSSRYSDGSFANFFTHVTFLFGFLPDYSFNTVLPDWSIGLEMQFYFIFPFLMLGVMKFGFTKVCYIAIFICIVAKFIFPDYFHAFPMPSLILIKLNLFISGMFVAKSILDKRFLYTILGVVSALASFYLQGNINKVRLLAEIGMIIMLAAVLWPFGNDGFWSKISQAPRYVLKNKVSVFMGDVSYSVYLLHLLIVLPTVSFLLSNSGFATLPSIMRFLVVAIITLPITYSISFFLYRFIEKPGIKLGKFVAGYHSKESVKIS